MAHVYIPYCDCDDCLNGSGGLVLPGAGVTHPTELAAAGAAVQRREREQQAKHTKAWLARKQRVA